MSLLSTYFLGIAAKRLSEVEINPQVSNQHEFNGINSLREIFGSERRHLKGKYIYLSDDQAELLEETGSFTWYDARENHPTRTEYRLYYSSSSVIESSNYGDLMVLGLTPDNEIIVIVAAEGTTAEQQVKWLFGLEQLGNAFTFRNIEVDDTELGFAGRHVLEFIGIEITDDAHDYLDQLLERFGAEFPATRDFSQFARETVTGVSPTEEPDKTLMAWLEREELLFKTLEKHIVAARLAEGFGNDGTDVDEFVSYSLSVHNRRKSRAGHSFENHLSQIFHSNLIHYSRGKKTERNNKPDFIFPGIDFYRNPEFSADLLTMLGVKTSAKDRWRQVLAEAARIPNKHLITLEPAISQNQTNEMRENNLQLVLPAPLWNTYSLDQQNSIISLSQFIEIVRQRQPNP